MQSVHLSAVLLATDSFAPSRSLSAESSSRIGDEHPTHTRTYTPRQVQATQQTSLVCTLGNVVAHVGPSRPFQVALFHCARHAATPRLATRTTMPSWLTGIVHRSSYAYALQTAKYCKASPAFKNLRGALVVGRVLCTQQDDTPHTFSVCFYTAAGWLRCGGAHCDPGAACRSTRLHDKPAGPQRCAIWRESL
jgi:hypothetical protein